ncbi:MAG: DUF554 domain-containing protein [Anaerolineales bacterium]|nr:DUF554 domain-containing protein [Anaerolineales bacterium]MCX7754280.1 DUF554 domain-containing protein [Anaerolineales bacterium]MDW8278685.1 DUF554 domain-containing protein [Anaerolineales bacterium]
MTGTFLNVVAILAGGMLGLLVGARLSDKLKETVVAGMGLFTTAVGLKMFLDTENELIVLGALLLGAILGEGWGLEDHLRRLGLWLERRFAGGSEDESNRFVRGFMTASLLYLIGPMAILGAISDGLTGDYKTLAIKSVLDGFASIAFASSLGIGVLFSAIPTLVYQGGISLLAAQLSVLITPSMMGELTATGGVLLMGVGVSSLLELKKIRVGNLLPALLIAPLIVYVVEKVVK